MRRLPTVRLLANSDLDRFIRRTVSRLRWATIAALLAISLIEPSAGRTRASDWVLVVLFAGYTLSSKPARSASIWSRSISGSW